MNEIILLVLLFLTMLTIYCLYRMLDKRGLYFSLVLMNIITFVLSFKITTIFKININSNIIGMVSIFTIIFIFLTKYGYNENKNLLLISFYSNITVALLIAIMNFFVPAVTETISINMQETFEYNYKILIIYPIIILISQYASIKLYKLINMIQNNILISIMLTHIIISLLYTIVFSTTAYIKILEVKYSLFIGISTYIIGLPLAIMSMFYINYIVNKKVIQ